MEKLNIKTFFPGEWFFPTCFLFSVLVRIKLSCALKGLALDEETRPQGQTTNPQISQWGCFGDHRERKKKKTRVPCSLLNTCNSREKDATPAAATTQALVSQEYFTCKWAHCHQWEPDLKDRNVVVAVVLSQQGDLGPLPERLLWVVDCKVSGAELEQSEHFYLDFEGVSKYKHVNLL